MTAQHRRPGRVVACLADVVVTLGTVVTLVALLALFAVPAALLGARGPAVETPAVTAGHELDPNLPMMRWRP